MSRKIAALSPAQVLALPAMPSVQQAFGALNIGEALGYELIKNDEFPVEVLSFGRAFRVRKADLLAFLRLTEAANDAAPGSQPGAESAQAPEGAAA
ncbi:hypothetical protein [Streptomyces showdoensis]|uniref:hypothetical protein n=1 Tax=Streptomyces showdoensis TaxID=68268 RepID=UPI000F509850|nr:hypothetical protein [Streptomyces showdoensis]